MSKLLHPTAPTSGNPAAVLVVEVEPLVCLYFSDVLRQSGFDVIAAATSEEALALGERDEFCMVISEVAMPGPINGFELARRIKRNRPKTGVILVSGIMEPAGYHLPRGVRFVTKPVKASTLLRLVRELADPRPPLPASSGRHVDGAPNCVDSGSADKCSPNRRAGL